MELLEEEKKQAEESEFGIPMPTPGIPDKKGGMIPLPTPAVDQHSGMMPPVPSPSPAPSQNSGSMPPAPVPLPSVAPNTGSMPPAPMSASVHISQSSKEGVPMPIPHLVSAHEILGGNLPEVHFPAHELNLHSGPITSHNVQPI